MPATLPVGSVTVVSIGLTAAVVGNAYYQKKQFYPSVVYITKSNPSLAAIYLLAFSFVFLLGKLLKKVFFGQLRTAEFEQLLERSFYAVTETCLAFTVFRDDFSPKFVSLFTVLLFLKAFHYLTDSRVDFMERSPVITMLFHIRVTGMLLLLVMMDLLFLNYAFLSTMKHGASVQIVFGFEYAILLTVGLNIGIKYICHSIDLRSENPWENKAVYLLYTELLVGLAKAVLFILFLGIMIRIHTFPLFIIRPMYLALRSFKDAFNDVIQSRRAIHNMNTLYPDATSEELASVDNVCIICREEMTSGAKKLPCGHIFHSSCLRSWFQRQQTCPTCRMNILQQTVPLLNQGVQQQQQQPAPQGTPAPAAQQPQDNVNPVQQGEGRGHPGNMFMAAFQFGQNMPFRQMQFTGFPFNQIQQQIWQQQQQQLQQFQQQQNQQQPQQSSETLDQATGGVGNGGAAAAGNSSAGPSVGQSTFSSTSASNVAGSTSSTNASSQKMNFPLGPMPPFLPFMPFSIPPPPPPPNFEGLTLEELRKMEGNERSHVEARIKTLKNIQTLLDAAAIQLSQYNSVVSSLEAITSVSNQAVERKLENLSSPGPSRSEKSPESKAESALNGSESKGPSTSSASGGLAASSSSASSSDSASSSSGAAMGVESVSKSGSDSKKSVIKSVTVNATDDLSTVPPILSGSVPSDAEEQRDPDDPNEIRRRRLEKFSSSSSSSSSSSPSAEKDNGGGQTPTSDGEKGVSPPSINSFPSSGFSR